MARRILLTASVLLLIWQSNIAFRADSDCAPIDLNAGTCVAGSLNNDSATLDGSTSTRGGGATPDYSGGDSSDPTAPAPCEKLNDLSCVRDTFTVTSPITLADIAAFRPNPATDSMEPGGWAVIGLPTNFFGSSGSEIHDGVLLGQPASVRFTPVSWTWNYGDGSSATSSTSGASWNGLGIREFDATPTSHVFRTQGSYTISLTISYSAEYRVGALGWIPIAGTLPVAANELTVVAGDAKTVLVNHDCRANPRGPGC